MNTCRIGSVNASIRNVEIQNVNELELEFQRIKMKSMFGAFGELLMKVYDHLGVTQVLLLIPYNVPDCITGEVIVLYFIRKFPMPRSTCELLHFVEVTMRNCIEHEFQECLLFDGIRHWDPHVESAL